MMDNLSISSLRRLIFEGDLEELITDVYVLRCSDVSESL